MSIPNSIFFRSEIEIVIAGRIKMLLLPASNSDDNNVSHSPPPNPFLTELIGSNTATSTNADGGGYLDWNQVFSQSRRRLGLPDLRLDGPDSQVRRCL